MGACSIRIPICQFSSYPQQAPGIVSSLVGHTTDRCIIKPLLCILSTSDCIEGSSFIICSGWFESFLKRPSTKFLCFEMEEELVYSHAATVSSR